MPTTPIRYASFYDGNTGDGSASWNTPEGVNGIGGGTANILTGALGPGSQSQRLRARSFPDFAADIPAGSTINGVEVIVSGFSSTTYFITLTNIQLQKSDGLNIGTGQATFPQQDATAGGSSKTYGGTGNLWGTTLSYADVTSTSFAVALNITNRSSKFSNISRIDIDSIGMRITYTDPPSTTTTTTTSTTTSTTTTTTTSTTTTTTTATPSTTTTPWYQGETRFGLYSYKPGFGSINHRNSHFKRGSQS